MEFQERKKLTNFWHQSVAYYITTLFSIIIFIFLGIIGYKQ